MVNWKQGCIRTCYQLHVIEACSCFDSYYPVASAFSLSDIPVCSTLNITQGKKLLSISLVIINRYGCVFKLISFIKLPVQQLSAIYKILATALNVCVSHHSLFYDIPTPLCPINRISLAGSSLCIVGTKMSRPTSFDSNCLRYLIK